MSNTSLVLLTKDNQPVTTSLIIANAIDLTHQNVIKNVKKYQKQLEQFGLVGFQIQPRSKGQHGGGDITFAILNEQQATFLISLSRNTDKVVEFKLALTKAFFEAKEYIRKQQEKEHEDLKFDVKKPWYVEQLLELLKHYTVSEAALKKVIDITERAWKQGYAVAMAKVEKEQAEQKSTDDKDNSGTVEVKFSTVLNMLSIANYISGKFEYYLEAAQLMKEVIQKLEIVKNDTESLCALGDMKMPLLCGELKRLSYTEDQQRLVDKTLYPWRRDKKEENAA